MVGQYRGLQIAINISDIISYKSAYLRTTLDEDSDGVTIDTAFIINTRQGFAYKFNGEREEIFQHFKQIIPSAEQLPHETEDEAKVYECGEGHPCYQQAEKMRKVDKAASVAASVLRKLGG